MLVMPAIDIRGGRCVRLFKGDFDRPTVYDTAPEAVAEDFVREGAGMLHLIDLDGAESGAPVNDGLILRIVRRAGVPVQVGGGIQTYAAARAYLDGGVRRVLLGTAAVDDPELVRRLIDEFGDDRIAVAADVKDGRLAINGWKRSSGLTVDDALDRLSGLGIRTVLVTDVSKDGTLRGPGFDLTQRFIDAGLRTIAAGGITGTADISELRKRGAYGAVTGKAMYEGTLDIASARKAAAYRNTLAKRIIPCLDVKDGMVVKGTNFKSLKTVGDPVGMAALYSRAGADELVFLDIAATREGRGTFRGLVADIAVAIDIPFTVGGGIRTVDDIRGLLKAGADKVSLGTAAVEDPSLVARAAARFGSQCIVISVDAKRRRGGWEVYTRGGGRASGVDVLEFCGEMQDRGAGELLINSLDRDGTDSGFDLELLQAVTRRSSIPVIASSGGGSKKDFAEVFHRTGVDAALGASIFHYKGVTPSALKRFLKKQGVEVRP